MVSVLVRDPTRRSCTLVTKGAPETVLEPLHATSPARRAPALAAEFAAGNRVIAVATRPPTDDRAPDDRATSTTCTWPASSSSSTRRRPTPPRRSARLAGLGIAVKVDHRRQPGRGASRCAATSG